MSSARRTLVLGGARSGKSARAEELIAAAGPGVRYLATARVAAADDDFRHRIAAHRARRPATWSVVENTDAVAALANATSPTLLDDVGTWLTNVLDDAGAWELPRGTIDVDPFVSAVAGYTGRLVLVSPEVGLGVVPASASGRLFRDELGTLNQRLAQVCDDVEFVVAGLPIQLKGSPSDRNGSPTDTTKEV